MTTTHDWAYMKVYFQKRGEACLCIQCGLPQGPHRKGKQRCSACTRRRGAKQRDKRGYPLSTNACLLCGDFGHKPTTCPLFSE